MGEVSHFGVSRNWIYAGSWMLPCSEPEAQPRCLKRANIHPFGRASSIEQSSLVTWDGTKCVDESSELLLLPKVCKDLWKGTRARVRVYWSWGKGTVRESKISWGGQETEWFLLKVKDTEPKKWSKSWGRTWMFKSMLIFLIIKQKYFPVYNSVKLYPFCVIEIELKPACWNIGTMQTRALAGYNPHTHVFMSIHVRADQAR